MAEISGFVFESNCGRGTLSIIWSCLATITFVVWTVLHPHFRQNLPRLVWAILIFFLPEALPAGAIEQLTRARQLQTCLRGVPGWEGWTLKQSFLVIKQGVKYRNVGDEELKVLEASRLIAVAKLLDAQRKDEDSKSGSAIVERAASSQVEIKSSICTVPVIVPLLDAFPSDVQIDKRSKKGWFEKIIAVGQAAWFAANVIYRLADGLQVTPLEDLTVAYTLCGLVSAIAWFRCPQDLEDGFEIEMPTEETSVTQDGTRQGKLDGVLVDSVLVLAITYGTLAVFTGIHLAFWSYPFPSVAEAWIWRSCALGTLLFGALVLRFGDMRHYGKAPHWSLAIALPGYLGARLALLVVAFTAFRRMPASAFSMPNWPNYWGHIGN
ncbi:unnamed protein product [Discula destructiva]